MANNKPVGRGTRHGLAMADNDRSDDRVSDPLNRPFADVNRVGQPGDPAWLDMALALLAERRRRVLLSNLADRPGEPVPTEDLVDVVRAHEAPDPGPTDHRTRVAVDLHHVQLPKLADADVIERDAVDGTVRFTGSEELTTLVAEITDLEASST